jgi:hypothetical protein
MKPLRPTREVLIDWAPELSLKLGRPVEVILSRGLTGYDFSPAASVEIRDPAGMRTRVEFAFAVIRPGQNLAAVFSEHCGYMEFDLLPDMVVAEIREEIYIHFDDEAIGDSA